MPQAMPAFIGGTAVCGPICGGIAAGVVIIGPAIIVLIQDKPNIVNNEESDGILDTDPETGKLKGDVPISGEIPDDLLEDVIGELEGSLGARQLEQMDMPQGHPNGSEKEKEEHKRYQGHEERIDREAKLYDDLIERLPKEL